MAINGRDAGLRSGRACLGPSSHSVNLQIRLPPGGVRVRGSFCECGASKFMCHLIRVLVLVSAPWHSRSPLRF